MPAHTIDRSALKKAAAEEAVAEIADGMVVGLGSGSTAAFAIQAIGARVRAGLHIAGIATSESTAILARTEGISLTTLDQIRQVDLTIDGADQIERGTLNLVKGLGGALLREKIVASASARMVVIADEAKLVDRLGQRTPLPVEITAFGRSTIIDRIAAAGYTPTLRVFSGEPFVTDSGNFIADCSIPMDRSLAQIENTLRGLVGVIETGLFLGLAAAAYIGTASGVEVMRR